MTTFMDLASAHKDLQTLIVNGKLDFARLYQSLGSISIYYKRSSFDSTSFDDRMQALGHRPVCCDNVLKHLIHDLWTTKLSAVSVVSTDHGLLPVCRALKAIGTSVTFITTSSPRKEFAHRWLHELNR